jgi:hypothetical protein
MAKYKPVFKGVRYITNKLLKRYPKRFTNRSDASKQAHVIYEQLKASNTKVNLKNAFALIPKQEPKHKKVIAPVLESELTDLTHYFLLEDYPLAISSMLEKPELLFESDIVPSGLPPIMSGSMFSYEEYFAPFVTHIDEMRNKVGVSPTMYSDDWYVKCTEPVWNKDKQVWVSKIISCDANGDEQDYGFNKDNPSESIANYNRDNKPTPKEKPSKEVKKYAESKTEVTDIDKQIELERIKLEQLNQRNIESELTLKKLDKVTELIKLGFSLDDARKMSGL